jgi:hypothetical protein
MLEILIAAAVVTAVDAERAFFVDAQAQGQWTAFRKWAAPEALLFTPQPVNAHEFLKDRKDPPVSVVWWPAESYVSCDGRFAVNTGPWVRNAGKSVGYFTTVWRRRQDKDWRWIYDAGDALKEPRDLPERPKVQKASCEGTPRGANVLGTIPAQGYRSGGGRSGDGTLVWSWAVGPKGERHFLTQLWNGRAFETVVEDKAAAE